MDYLLCLSVLLIAYVLAPLPKYPWTGPRANLDYLAMMHEEKDKQLKLIYWQLHLMQQRKTRV